MTEIPGCTLCLDIERSRWQGNLSISFGKAAVRIACSLYHRARCDGSDASGAADSIELSAMRGTSPISALGGLSGQAVLFAAAEQQKRPPGGAVVRMHYDPNEGMPRPTRSLIYFGACLIAGIRLAREKQVNVRVVPTIAAIEESIDLAHEIFNRVFRKMPDGLERKICRNRNLLPPCFAFFAKHGQLKTECRASRKMVQTINRRSCHTPV
jgi:hypothetical protein